MKVRHIPALLLALSPIWVTASVYAEEVNGTQVDPVAAIDDQLTAKQGEIDSISSKYDAEVTKLQQLKNEKDRLNRTNTDLEGKRNRAKAALDKQYNRLLEDPETDLATFQKQYQEAWAEVKKNQSALLDNEQAAAETEISLSQLKQKRARIQGEYENLQESRVEARIKRLNAELMESSVVNTSYKTTCSTTMTLGECANQGVYLTKQKTVSAFKDTLLNGLTESILAKQNMKGVNFNILIKDSQIVKSGFQGNNEYFTEMQAQLQARPEAIAACKLLSVSTRYCLKGQSTPTKKAEKKWASVTVRSDQYNDSVTIDGVNYGSTPVEISLPVGRHQVTVAKSGYETYNQVVTINNADTVWVKLQPNKND